MVCIGLRIAILVDSMVDILIVGLRRSTVGLVLVLGVRRMVEIVGEGLLLLSS